MSGARVRLNDAERGGATQVAVDGGTRRGARKTRKSAVSARLVHELGRRELTTARGAGYASTCPFAPQVLSNPQSW